MKTGAGRPLCPYFLFLGKTAIPPSKRAAAQTPPIGRIEPQPLPPSLLVPPPTESEVVAEAVESGYSTESEESEGTLESEESSGGVGFCASSRAACNSAVLVTFAARRSVSDMYRL